MASTTKPRVLILGAGSMGLACGYMLTLSGASTTFLVRPHRASQLSRPQKLYSYDDNTLKTYSDFTFFTTPSDLLKENWDFIVITLDSTALQSAEGVELCKIIGEAGRKDKNVKVLLGSVGVGMQSWFVETSGLPGDQATLAWFVIHVYSPSAVSLPIPDDPAVVNRKLLEQADQAYTAKLGGFLLDDSAPRVQKEFVELWEKCGLCKCTTKPAKQFSAESLPMFAVFSACDLLGWGNFENVTGPNADEEKSNIWKLATEAVKDVARLGMHGDAGIQVAEQTSEEGLANSWFGMEKLMRPFDFVAFSKYHHGGKVNKQDRVLLTTCIRLGEEEGKSMDALKTLVQRVEEATS